MRNIYLLWDNGAEQPEFLCEDGRFWFYFEAEARLESGYEDGGGFWWSSPEYSALSVLNDPKRYDIYDDSLNKWVPLLKCRRALWRRVLKAARVKNWQKGK